MVMTSWGRDDQICSPAAPRPAITFPPGNVGDKPIEVIVVELETAS
jgi:hypothetical protein